MSFSRGFESGSALAAGPDGDERLDVDARLDVLGALLGDADDADAGGIARGSYREGGVLHGMHGGHEAGGGVFGVHHHAEQARVVVRQGPQAGAVWGPDERRPSAVVEPRSTVGVEPGEVDVETTAPPELAARDSRPNVTLGSRASRPAMGVVVNGTSTRSSTAEGASQRIRGDPPGTRETRAPRKSLATTPRAPTPEAPTTTSHAVREVRPSQWRAVVARPRGCYRRKGCVPLEPRTPSGCLSERSNLQKIQIRASIRRRKRSTIGAFDKRSQVLHFSPRTDGA